MDGKEVSEGMTRRQHAGRMKTGTLVEVLAGLIQTHGERFWLAIRRINELHCPSCGGIMRDLYVDSGVHQYCEKCEVYRPLRSIDWWDEDVDNPTLELWKQNEEKIATGRLLEPIVPSEPTMKSSTS